MGSRPEFSIAEFVRVRREFDDWRGPAEAWARLNEVSMWRLDQLAERAGSRTWTMLVAPPDPERSHQEHEQQLLHALRSSQIAASALPTFWRFGQVRIAMSYVVVAHQAEVQQALRLAQRYGQVAVADAQRIPFEQVVIHDLVAERCIELRRFEPSVIAECMAQMVGADAAAVLYRWTTIGEGMAMDVFEWRPRSA